MYYNVSDTTLAGSLVMEGEGAGHDYVTSIIIKFMFVYNNL